MPSSESTLPPGPPRPPRRVIPDHTLLRCIGKGSYGEVWLARSLVGALRAVKIVWRSSFDNARPYEREFAGIKCYEPISRGHPGLVDLLHVGRDEKAKCFFYVMELADDATTNSPLLPASNTDHYRPKTLRELQKSQGRLPITMCLDLGAQIAAGLSRLHESGLVHRDIKPSNVIFVNDQPKLADIGLLASMGEALSFVGTEGFVAPEGPGKARADIFSFGYEMATGLDRNEFPKLPALEVDEAGEAEAFTELNEVFLRACDPDPARRYESADELRRELLLLQGGRSVRQLRVLERRAAFARKASIVLGAAAVIATVAYFGSFRQMQRAHKAEAQALANERKALANVELLQLQKAEEHFRHDDSSTALAILAHLVRQNPTNHVAAERLLAALTWRNFALPKMKPILPEGRPRMALFNLQDTEILTGSYAGVLQTWNVETGKLKSRIQFNDGRIYWIDYSRDGKLAAIAGQGYTAIVNATTLQPTLPLMRISTNRVQTVHFSPDQRWLLMSGQDPTARHVSKFWDTTTGQPVGAEMFHGDAARFATFSPDSTRAVTGARNGAVRIWEVPSGRPLTPILWHTTNVWKVTFSPDGKLIASASDDFQARLWDGKTGALRAVLRHKNCVVDVEFSPDGTKVVTASEDLSAIVWDVATGRQIGNPLRHRNRVRQAKFSPDGRRVVTASEDNTTRIWDAETTRPITEPMRHTTEVLQAKFSYDGKSLVSTVSSTTGEEVWLWNATSEGARGLPLLAAAHASDAWFSRDGSRIAAACDDGMVRLWNPSEDRTKETLLRHDGPVQRVAFSLDGKRLASVQGSKALVWDLVENKRIGIPLTHLEVINSVQFSSDGRSVLTSSADGTACVWNAETGDRQLELPPSVLQTSSAETRRHDISTASFSPNDQLIVTASRNGRATVWNADTGELAAEFFHEHWVTHAEFSPDGKTVLTASIDRTARIWDIGTKEQVGASMTHDSDITTAHFSHDGRMVITASLDWTARVWDAASGRPISDMMRHQGPVGIAAFSPDGSHVVTGADDGMVRLWDTATGLSLNDGFQHSSAIDCIRYSPDGSSLLVVSKNGDLTLYELLRPTFPVPQWLPELAEAVAGQRLGATGKFESASPNKFFQLRDSLELSPNGKFYTRWAAWFLQDSNKRTISPQAKLFAEDYSKPKPK